MSRNSGIKIEFDDIYKDYYIIWRLPIAIGSGSTKIEALNDLQTTAHFAIDSLIN